MVPMIGMRLIRPMMATFSTHFGSRNGQTNASPVRSIDASDRRGSELREEEEGQPRQRREGADRRGRYPYRPTRHGGAPPTQRALRLVDLAHGGLAGEV